MMGDPFSVQRSIETIISELPTHKRKYSDIESNKKESKYTEKETEKTVVVQIYNKIVKSRKEEVIGTCVRGFHPQFCSWQQNFDLLSTSAKSTGLSLKDIEDTENVDKLVNTYRQTVRKETNRRKEKCSIHTRELKRKNQIDNFHQTTYREMYINSHVPQLIASPTGSIISCNNEFSTKCNLTRSQVSSSLTVFDLALPSMIPKLFEMFALALREEECNIPPSKAKRSSTTEDMNILIDSSPANQHILNNNIIQGEENLTDKPTYCSLSIPCTTSGDMETQLIMTITFMDDIEPSNRCFHCLFSSDKSNDLKFTDQIKLSIAVGRVQSIDQSILARLI